MFSPNVVALDDWRKMGELKVAGRTLLGRILYILLVLDFRFLKRPLL